MCIPLAQIVDCIFPVPAHCKSLGSAACPLVSINGTAGGGTKFCGGPAGCDTALFGIVCNGGGGGIVLPPDTGVAGGVGGPCLVRWAGGGLALSASLVSPVAFGGGIEGLSGGGTFVPFGFAGGCCTSFPNFDDVAFPVVNNAAVSFPPVAHAVFLSMIVLAASLLPFIASLMSSLVMAVSYWLHHF